MSFVFQVAALFLGIALANPALGASYAKVTLPKGVSIEVPQGWFLASPALARQMQISAETYVELSGLPLPPGANHKLLFARSVPEETFASLSVDIGIPASFSQREVLTATVADLKAYTEKARPTFEKVVATLNERLLTFEPVHRISVSGSPALVTAYTRTGTNGPVSVEIIQVFTPESDIGLTLSFRISEAVLWKPIIAKIRSSLAIKR